MATATLAPGLARKVKKCLSLDLESEGFIEALTTVSKVFPVNTPQSRSKLKATVEQSLVDVNSEFLRGAQAFVFELDATERRLSHLSASCDAIGSSITDSHSATAALLTRSDQLASELAAVQRKAAVVDTFREHYQLDPADAETLESSEIDESFFAALARVRRVQVNCRALLHTHHQRAGLELLDSMAAFQEAAYERLCKWVQVQCQSLSEADHADVHPRLPDAASALRSQPVLLRYCADEVATARHSAVFQAFLMALTRGGPGGVPRPIEVHAHNPRRYVGDMLAWVHQALASECELLSSLFEPPPELEEVPLLANPLTPSAPTPIVAADKGVAIDGLLNKVFEGVCRPLRVRIEQLLLANPPMILCLHLLQLLAFYTTTVTSLVSSESALAVALMQLRDKAASGFQEQMQARSGKLQRAPPSAPRALTCAPEITQLVEQVLEVVEAYEGSMNAGAPGSEATQAFDSLFKVVLDPVVDVCERSADTLPSADLPPIDAASDSDTDGAALARLPPGARRMYLINCLLALWSPLSLRKACAEQAAALKTRIDAEVEELARSEASRLLSQCGLRAVCDTVTSHTTAAAAGEAPPPLAAADGLSGEVVTAAMNDLFQLASAADTIPDYERMVQPRLRVATARRVAQQVAAAYALVYEAANDEQHGFGIAEGTLKPPALVATLLGVQEKL